MSFMKNSKKENICIIGLGYVGLPLCVEFVKFYNVYGYDLNLKRIQELKKNIDRNNELTKNELKKLSKIKYLSSLDDLKNCSTYIVTVPTPINSKNKPELKYIKKATIDIGKKIKKNDLVIYESTVFPGMTEEYCVPILEKISKLKFNKDFYCGYSPERINPGDKKRKLKNIIKIVSGSNIKTLNRVNNLYKKIIQAGTYKVESIIIAEAAKVIENTQRDLNIAFVNELSKIFNKMNISTIDVLNAASTKWNFLKFTPGLVGGHCIGVDPYYLTYKAKKLNYNPKVILSGRKINDSMPTYVVNNLKKIILSKSSSLNKKKILIMGYSFKENCNDFRNSKVKVIVNEILKSRMIPYIFDPYIKKEYIVDKQKNYFINFPKNNFYDAILICVAHDVYKNIGIKKINNFLKEKKIIFDLKKVFPKKYSSFSL